MLGTKSRPKPATDTQSSNSQPSKGGDKDLTCVIAEGTHIEGIIKSNTNIRVDGSIKGTVNCQEKLVMGETGIVEGTISTKDAIITGTFDGNLIVNGTLHLKSMAVIKGDITAEYLIVDEGAQYFGKCNIGK
ncbi:MAG: cytoskeletal protein CcmA (bactofilin family) [Paraglaciecola sp.]|jgi:cytoskeletal protein CcmA (bactofilin family)